MSLCPSVGVPSPGAECGDRPCPAIVFISGLPHHHQPAGLTPTRDKTSELSV